MAIYYGDGDWHGVERRFLREVVAVPVCSPGFLEAKPDLKQPADLARQPLIDVSNRPEEWDDFLAELGLTRPKSAKRLSFSSTSLALGAAMENLGIVLADRDLVAREMRYGQLVNPLGIELPVPEGYYLVYQENRKLTDEMRAFLDWMIETIAEEKAATA